MSIYIYFFYFNSTAGTVITVGADAGFQERQMRSGTVDITVRAKIHVPKTPPRNYRQKHASSEAPNLL